MCPPGFRSSMMQLLSCGSNWLPLLSVLDESVGVACVEDGRRRKGGGAKVLVRRIRRKQNCAHLHTTSPANKNVQFTFLLDHFCGSKSFMLYPFFAHAALNSSSHAIKN